MPEASRVDEMLDFATSDIEGKVSDAFELQAKPQEATP